MDLAHYPDFDTRHLRYFLAIVECGSISKAALRLNVAQPALSLAVKEMEEKAGVELLIRLPRGISPTAAGAVLASEANAILSRISLIGDKIQNEFEDPAGAVAIGLPSSIGQLVTIQLVETVLKRYPRIRLSVSEALTGTLVDWIADHAIDLGLTFTAMNRKDVLLTPILEEEIVLVASPEYTRLIEREDVRLSAPEQLNLLLPGSAHGIRRLVDGIASLGSAKLHVIAEVNTQTHLKELACRGLGFTILPRFLVQKEVENGTLKTWSLGMTPVTRTIHIATSSTRPISNAAQAVCASLKTLIIDLVNEGKWAARLV